jgi:hypothetical protein
MPCLISNTRRNERNGSGHYFAIVLAIWQPEGLLITAGMTTIAWLRSVVAKESDHER